MLEMQIVGSYLRPTKLEILGIGSSMELWILTTNPPRGFRCAQVGELLLLVVLGLYLMNRGAHSLIMEALLSHHLKRIEKQWSQRLWVTPCLLKIVLWLC
jgi:hypothetical protein